jgi:hypothetical protein
LIAQEQLAADPFLKPVDPSHQGRAGETKHFGSVAKTPVLRTDQKRFQIVPGRTQNLFVSVLRHRSTPVQ